MTWRGPVWEDTVPLSFKYESVGPHEVTYASTCPVVGFRGKELAIANQDFDVLDVVVGSTSQIHRTERTMDAMLSMDAYRYFRFSSPIDIGANQPVRLVIRNVTDSASMFVATFFGVIVVPASEMKPPPELLSSPRSRRAGRGKTGGGSVRSVGTKTLGRSA